MRYGQTMRTMRMALLAVLMTALPLAAQEQTQEQTQEQQQAAAQWQQQAPGHVRPPGRW